MELKVNTPDEALLVRQSTMSLEIAQAYQIDSQEMYLMAGDDLKAIKTRISELEAQRVSITKPINDGLKAINALFKKPSEILTQAEGVLKRAMLDYQQQQERLRLQEQARLDEEARQERARLAAAARAQEEDARRLEEEAQAAAAAAAAATGAEKAALEQQAAELSAQADDAQQDAAATQAVADVIPAHMPTIPREAPKVSGISTRETIKSEVTDKAALVGFIAAHPQYLDLLDVNNKALQQITKALGTKLELPGVRVFTEKSIASGRG